MLLPLLPLLPVPSSSRLPLASLPQPEGVRENWPQRHFQSFLVLSTFLKNRLLQVPRAHAQAHSSKNYCEKLAKKCCQDD
jgi:hypothetical protein